MPTQEEGTNCSFLFSLPKVLFVRGVARNAPAELEEPGGASDPENRAGRHAGPGSGGTLRRQSSESGLCHHRSNVRSRPHIYCIAFGLSDTDLRGCSGGLAGADNDRPPDPTRDRCGRGDRGDPDRLSIFPAQAGPCTPLSGAGQRLPESGGGGGALCGGAAVGYCHRSGDWNGGQYADLPL